MRELSAFVKEALERAELNPTKAAKRLGCSQPHVSLVVSGDRGIDLNSADKWIDVLGLDEQERTEFLDILLVRQISGPLADHVANLLQSREEVLALRSKYLALEDRLSSLLKSSDQ